MLVFDSSSLQKQATLPTEFRWPNADLLLGQQQQVVQELEEPLIDLGAFIRGDDVVATAHAVELVAVACSTHGFFQVTNHGVDAALIEAAHRAADTIFKLPLDRKLGARRKPGCVFGYSGAHADRYSSKLPWKETFSFGYSGGGGGGGGGSESDATTVVDYFTSVLGEDLEHAGRVYEKYCEAMREVSMMIFELLGVSLGIDRSVYKEYFEDGESIMRCNYYPPCNNCSLTLGTGPHCDPTSLTILHQDQVGGLQVFASNKWHAVQPRPHALVINIGDTFMALCNGRYKSCLHRAVVDRERERRTLVYFVSPKQGKVVRPPEDLVSRERPREYPDFTWSDFLDFTQKHYRADVATLQSFVLHHHHLLPSSNSKPSNSI